MLRLFIMAIFITGLSCHRGHHYFPGEISHASSATFLLDREKRSTDCNDEVACENDKPSCQNQNEGVRESYCSGHTCQQGSTCYLSTPCPAHYELGCIADPCASFPCERGGTCTKLSDTSFSCSCTVGYDPGTNCASEINECNSNPCQNGGQCVDRFNSYSCNCVPGYMGTNCEIDIDECQSTPCQNGGSCNDLVNRFECDCTERYNGTVCEKDCRPGPADVLLVLDSSDSVNFNKSIDFITGLIKKIPIGSNDFQVALITFSWNASVEFTFDQYMDNATLLDVLNSVVKDGGPSYFTPALKLAEQMVSNASNGRRSWVPSYVIVISDGLSTDMHEMLVQAKLMQALGIRVLGVGIGKTVSHNDFMELSSSADDVFSSDNEDILQKILTETANRDCTDCISHTDSDVIFLVDRTQEGRGLGSASRIMREISSYLKLGINDVRVGLMTYASSVTKEFSLTTYTNHSDLYVALYKIARTDEDTNLTEALRYVQDHGFTLLNGGRPNSRKIIVLHSSGNWSDSGSIQSELNRLVTNGYRVFFIINTYDEKYEGVLISTVPELYGVLNAASTDLYKGLRAVASEATYEICDSDVFIKRSI